MRKLPIGIQDFGKLRRGNHVYVDKTSIIHCLIQGEGAYFLSRPRRFGKSLLCSTIEEIFKGNRELFQEIADFPALAMDSLEWEWKKYPVVLLSLNTANYSSVDVLISTLDSLLHHVAKDNGYRFSEEPLTLYNPFGLLNHFVEKGKFKPYWYTTGTPTFLIDLIKKQKLNLINLGSYVFRLDEYWIVGS